VTSAVKLADVQIVVLTTWFPSARNPSAGSFIARDVRALAHDHDVRVLHLAGPELDDGVHDFDFDGVPVERVALDVRSPKQWAAAARIARRFAEDGELLHTMAAPALLPYLSRRPPVPWVHTEHWSGVLNLAGSGRSRLARPLARRALEGPNVVVAVSDYLAGAVRSLRRGPVEVVGNIVDVAPSLSLTSSSRQRPRPAELHLVAIGTVKANKGWRLALSTIALLRERGVDASLTWFGDGPELAALRAEAGEMPVQTPGHVDATALREAMDSADMLLLPTVAETFSLVTVEALAAGLPVLATGVGAHAEFIAPGTGAVVAREPAALADAAVELAGVDRASVSRHGAQLAARFSEQNFRRRYAEIYERAVHQR
jgi:glycosyltransferase involved in cell wall biosynthesis